MTNETVNPIELHGDNKGGVVRYTCSDTNAIAKGTLLWFSDPRTVSGASTTTGPFAGIASTEKVAADGQTTIGVWTKGIFDLATPGDITAGELVVLSGQNLVSAAVEADIQSGRIIGKALEDAAASTDETIAVLVDC